MWQIPLKGIIQFKINKYEEKWQIGLSNGLQILDGPRNRCFNVNIRIY